jgi:hypothetical protein
MYFKHRFDYNQKASRSVNIQKYILAIAIRLWIMLTNMNQTPTVWDILHLTNLIRFVLKSAYLRSNI